MKKKILVTGGAGYIGSHMARDLVEAGYAVLVFDNLSTGHKRLVPRGADFMKGDLRNREDIKKAFEKHSIDAVMHFAASIVVPESVAHPTDYYENNVLASIHLLKMMLRYKVKYLIFSSTAATYGEPKHIPVNETDETVPTSPYGQSKLMFEKILHDTAVSHGLRYVSLRYFNACGAHPSGTLGPLKKNETLLIPNILKAAKNKNARLTIFGDDYPTPDGTCIRDYVHVCDLCRAHLLALKKLKKGMTNGIFNLGTQKGYSVKEVLRAAEKVIGKKIPVKIVGRRPGDPSKIVASTKKARRLLGWKPEMDLCQIIRTAWEWEKSL